MPEYDFLGFEVGRRKEDGFFVDQDKRVIYWPGRNSPGFMIPVSVADEIADNTYPGMPSRPFGRLAAELPASSPGIRRLCLFGSIISLSIAAYGIENLFPEILSHGGALGAVTISLAVLAGAYLSVRYSISNREYVTRIVEHLREDGFVEVPLERPVATKLRMSEYFGEPASPRERSRYLLRVLGLIVLIAGFGSGVLIFASRPGDIVVGLLFAVLLLSFLVVPLFLELRRPALGALNALSPHNKPIH